MTKKVVISGAGLAGSLLSITLKKRGYNVQLFEKRSDLRKDGDGAGRSINLIITAKGIKALEAVGIRDEIIAQTVPVTGRMMHDLEGKQTFQPYGKDDSECNYSVSRSGLNKSLLSIAEKEGVEIFFEDGLESIDFENKTAHFDKTKDVKFDLLFGSDGAGSKTRKELIRHRNGEETTHPLGADYKELFMPAAADGSYVIEKNALHIWPRGDKMLMALPNLDGSFTMTLYMSTKEFDSLKTDEDIENHFKKYYPDSISLMPDYISEFQNNPQGFLGTLRAKPWTDEDSVVLLGDAAHAIVPFFGQGMNASYEDITYLLEMMDKHGEDWPSILKDYEARQFLSGNAIADMAIENFTEMQDKVGNESFLLRKKVEHKLENTFPELYRSRYAMVTYTLIPYDLCQKAGLIQDKILEELC